MMNAAVKSNSQYTLKIVHDEDAQSPREDDNLGKMSCWHKRYSLGDEHKFSSPDDFLKSLVGDTIPTQDIISYVKDGKAGGLTLTYDKSAREWELKSYFDPLKQWFTAHTAAAPLDMKDEILCDAILDEMRTEDLLILAERTHIIMPLYLLDHGGITISTRDFNDRWDSGQVGWMYVSHEDIAKEYGDTSPESVERAEHLLKGEVETYDCYLRGECYGFMLFENGKQADSCWGFIGSFDEAVKSIREYLPEDAVPLADEAEYGDNEPDYEMGDDD